MRGKGVGSIHTKKTEGEFREALHHGESSETVSKRERESVCVCVRERERERETQGRHRKKFHAIQKDCHSSVKPEREAGNERERVDARQAQKKLNKRKKERRITVCNERERGFTQKSVS